MYSFLIRLKFWEDYKNNENEYAGREVEEFISIRANTFSEAMQYIEDFYGDDLLSVELIITTTELIKLSKEEYERIKNTEIF